MPSILRPTISQIFLARAQATPLSAAFRFKSTNAAIAPLGEWKRVNFGEFYQECLEIAHGLLSLDEAIAGKKVAILSHTRLEWTCADLAAIGLGAVTVPVYDSLPSRDVAQLMAHAEAQVAFVEDRVQLEKVLSETSALKELKWIVAIDPAAMQLAPQDGRVLSWQALRERGRRHLATNPGLFEKAIAASRPDQLATIVYTSGTTGDPKGVMLTHANLVSVLEDCLKVLGRHVRKEKETLLGFLPYSHILGRLESFGTHVFGWEECFAESFEKLPQNFLEIAPTIIFAVPRVFEKAYARIQTQAESAKPWERALLKQVEAAGKQARHSKVSWLKFQALRRPIQARVREGFGGRLRYAICGGAPLAREIGEYFETMGVLILEGYGLTETAAPVTINTVEHHRFGTVGRPLPDVKIKLDSDGEILIQSKKVFSGYFKNPAETELALDQGWLRTGDIGRLDGQGFLTITDRKKDLLITSGAKNVAPQKIERLAQGYPLLQHLVVVGDGRPHLAALITLDPEGLKALAQEETLLYSDLTQLTRHAKVQSRVQKIVDEINQRLAKFETIKRFVILPQAFSVEAGELTSTQKVRRAAVVSKFRQEIESLYQEDSTASVGGA